MLDGSSASEISNKIEVSVVSSNTKLSTNKACDHDEASHDYNSDSSHFSSYLSEAKLNACRKLQKSSYDMSSNCRPPSNCGRRYS